MTATRRRYLRAALVAAGAVAVVVATSAIIKYFGAGIPSGPATTGTNAQPATVSGAASGSGPVMSLHEAPQPIPDIRFQDGESRSLTLADFRGKVVLLNIWATWCGPCRREMPTLDRLQATLGGPDFQVVALSIDRAGMKVVSAFYAETGIEHLARYIDESGRTTQPLKVPGLPTTLLIDREGREIARHVGPAEWDTPAMVAFFKQQLVRHSGAARGIAPSATNEGSAS
jgi:thiol-disulfide isomerase/thioredoxin